MGDCGASTNSSGKSKQPQPPRKCTYANAGTVEKLQAEMALG